MKFNRKGFRDEELLDIYKRLVLPRLIEEKMLILLRQGKISKWFSGMGQEAISVGSAYAMNRDEYMLPMHRNLGVFTTRDVPLERLFAQFQGKASGFTKGRDRSFHFGSNEHHIVGMISHLGPQLGVADGIALANKLTSNGKATLVVTGDGGASEGDFHEAINTAAVWQLPVIFLVENNQWGLSTPSSEQFRMRNFTDKCIGYGIQGTQINGNNILEVISGVRQAASAMRSKPQPIMIEMLTFRMRGHEEASGTKYYPDGIQDQWSKEDPVANYKSFLKSEGLLSTDAANALEEEMRDEINRAWKQADNEGAIIFDKEKELKDLHAPFTFQEQNQDTAKNEMRLVDAIQDGLDQAMKKHDKLVLMGQDIADYGGVFKITEGFTERYGKERVRNTPLCESAILGAGLGLSINGHKAMVEMQFADFVSEGMTQICNNLAKIHWRWGQNADVVVRMPTGAGVAAGPFHSQSNESWFTHIPGLKVVYPAFPLDAKGLLLTAFEDPNPVMFFEHKALYRSLSQEVPVGYYNIPFGQCAQVCSGDELSIITYGMGVHWAMEIAKEFEDSRIEVIDLRTLVPIDKEGILESVKRTGKVLVLHEDTLFGGLGGEIASMISEDCFTYLDAPVKRLASLDTPVPFAPTLEESFLPKKQLKQTVEELLVY